MNFLFLMFFRCGSLFPYKGRVKKIRNESQAGYSPGTGITFPFLPDFLLVEFIERLLPSKCHPSMLNQRSSRTLCTWPFPGLGHGSRAMAG